MQWVEVKVKVHLSWCVSLETDIKFNEAHTTHQTNKTYQKNVLNQNMWHKQFGHLED